MVQALEHEDGISYVQFNLNFYVDDIKLEDGKRGDRISSQIYQEILQYLYYRQVGEKVAVME